MSRTYKQIVAGQQHAQTALRDSEIQGLPPGYIDGFRLTLNDDFNVSIAPGVANVNGTETVNEEDYLLVQSDWIGTKAGTIWWYVYIIQTGAFEVRISEPIYDTEKFGFYDPAGIGRYIGKLSLTDGKIDYVVNQGSVAVEDVEADTIEARMILSSALQAQFANIGYSITIGYAGTGTIASPDEGDRRIYIDEDEIGFEIYTDGTWSTERQIALGGIDSNSNFRPFLACRGILGDITDSPLLDPIPGRGFHLFKFDNNAEDQHGVDPWTVTLGAFVYDAGTKWEGTHSLSPSAVLLNAWYAGGWAVGDSVTACFMFRDEDYAVVGHDIIEWGIGNDQITIEYRSTHKMRFSITKNTTVTYVESAVLSQSNWHFVAITYNSDTDFGYLRVDDVETELDPNGAWGAGTVSIYLTFPGGGSYHRFLDDLLISHDTAMDPDLFFQHVNRDVAWTADYFAPDVLLKPKPGGRVIIDDSDTEPSFGTGHWRGDSAGNTPIVDQNPATVSTWYTATFSNAPPGAKGAWGFVLLTRVANGGSDVFIRKYGDTQGFNSVIRQTISANTTYNGCLCWFPLDSSKRAQVGTVYALNRLCVYEVIFYDI